MAHGKKREVQAKKQEHKAKKEKAAKQALPTTDESRGGTEKQREPKAKKTPAKALPATTGKPRHGQRHVAIEEDMTIYTASTHKVMLLEALANCQELDLDLSQVSEMDTAGFQLLLLTKREAMQADKEVRLTAHSKAVTELLDLYNMAGYFGDPLVIPAGENTSAGKASR